MDSTTNIQTLLDTLEQSIALNIFIKLTLSNKRNSSSELNTVYVKPVMIKDQFMLSFIDRYKTKDITRNMGLEEAKAEITKLLQETFIQGYLATTSNDYHLLINKKGNSTLLQKPPASTKAPKLGHDKEKQRLVETQQNKYLQALGILSSDWKVKHDKQDKYRQINKYIEILDGILKDSDVKDKVHIADMGSGKGYLTFALYDHLTKHHQWAVEMTGVELRKELVDSCNVIANQSGFTGLQFKEGTIESTPLQNVNLLIALHACDTATDEAISQGIKSGADIIVCSPCCHKQVRKDMQTNGVLAEITQFGILEERQAEILTDTIRALTLQAYGYKTNVAEFIATEHTPKNILISAVRKKVTETPDPAIIQKINDLKVQFNINKHHLQEIMGY